MKKTLLLYVPLLILGGMLLVVLVGFLVILAISFFFSSLFGKEKPDIVYGEFPFKLVYTINDGQYTQYTIEDTLIIEYDGVWIDGGKPANDWKCSLKSGAELPIVLREGTDEEGNSFKITFYLGSGDYYMGEAEEFDGYPDDSTVLPGDVYNSAKGWVKLNPSELGQYNVYIDEVVLSPPIK